MPEIRLIKDDETDLMREAWGWQYDTPKWFQEHQAAEDETLEDFINGAKDVLMYGIFDDSFTSLIRLNPMPYQTYSLDLFAKRKTDWNVLCQAGLSLKQYLFDNGVNGFWGWVAERNRSVIALYKALGFGHNGVAYYKGQMHGRAVKWLLMTSVKNIDK